MKTQYPRWKVILGFIMFFMVMGIVGRIEQAPDVDTPQAILEERVNMRDQIKLAMERQDERDRVYVAEMVKRGQGK
jgi:hypothetical protein